MSEVVRTRGVWFAAVALLAACLSMVGVPAFAAQETVGGLVAGQELATDEAQTAVALVASQDAQTTTTVKVPGKAVLKKTAARSAGRLLAQTANVKGADGYIFKVSRSRNFKEKPRTFVAKKNTVVFKGLRANTKYYVKVRAYKKDGKSKKKGAWSKVGTCTTRKIKIGVVDLNPSTTSQAGGWLRRNGCNVVPIRTTKIDPAKYDGLVIPGGGDVDPALYGQKKNSHDYGINRKRDLLQIKVINMFADAGKPIIGVCRGCQVLNVALGGTLYQHIPGWHLGSRTVKIKKGSWLYDLFGASESVSHSHHQCVQKLGKGLVATQWDKRDRHIEAIEHESLPIFGLQWHPEGMGSRGSAVARRFMHECIVANK